MMDTIIYIGGFELPDKNAAAHRVISNAKALRNLGYNVVLVDVDRETKKMVDETKSECFGFTRYSMQYNNQRFTAIDDFISVLKYYKSDDVKVIAYNYPGIALWKMRDYCKKNGIKIYADCTEWYGMEGEDFFIKRAIRGFDSFVRMRIVQPKLDGIIVISRYLEKYYKRKLPSICIPPLTDVTDEKWKKENAEEHDGIQIVYAGNPGKHKDKINRIIEALETIENKSVCLSVVGITKKQFLAYYPEDAEALDRLGKNVIFLGRVPHEQVICKLKQADFSMFYREITRISMAGFPTKFAEAITCGTPVITNKTSDLENYMEDGVNGFWIDDDIAASAGRIFQNDVSLFREMKKTMNREMFDYHKYLDEFGAIF